MKKSSLVSRIVLRDIDFMYHDVPIITKKSQLINLPKYVLERILETQKYNDYYIVKKFYHKPFTIRSCMVFPQNVKYKISLFYKLLYRKKLRSRIFH